MPLNDSAKSELLVLARATLESYLCTKTIPEYHTSRPELRTRAGAFVSLHRGEELRGCIGHLAPDKELFRTVQRCAISAALEDLRFNPVTFDELASVHIEISVLEPFRRITSPDEIEVGRHGLYIVRGGYRGLLLPQVATQYGWDRTKFLAQTCRKAGLTENAWSEPGVIVNMFEAQVFGEAERQAGQAIS